MSNTLMILAPPVIEQSIGNRIISDNIAQQDNTEVRHLDQLYPNFEIDVTAEHEALLKADTIIFQFPLFWYNMPALLKHWIDKVFLYGFAFGSESKLINKRVIVSFTIGSSEKDYPDDIIQKITFPFQGLSKYCKMDYVTEIFCNDINGYSEVAKNKAIDIAHKHSQRLIELTK